MKPSYLYDRNPYTGKMASLYQDGPRFVMLLQYIHLHVFVHPSGHLSLYFYA